MTTQFMRNYIDLINEIEQPHPQQVDEGVIDSLVGKFKQLKDRFMAVPGAAQALKRAEPYRDQLEAIAKNSKSGQEVMAAIKDLVAQASKKDTAAVPITEIVTAAAGAFAGLAGLYTAALGLINGIYVVMGLPTMGSSGLGGSLLTLIIGVTGILFGILAIREDIDMHKQEK